MHLVHSHFVVYKFRRFILHTICQASCLLTPDHSPRIMAFSICLNTWIIYDMSHFLLVAQNFGVPLYGTPWVCALDENATTIFLVTGICDAERIATLTPKARPGNMSIVSGVLIDIFFFTASPWDSISDSPAAKVTLIEHCMCSGTALAGNTPQGSTIVFPEPFSYESSSTFFTRSDATFANNMTVVTGLKCIGTTLCLVWNMWQMHLLVNDVRSNRYTARFATLWNHVHVWGSPMLTCREMRPCTGDPTLVPVFRGEAQTGLTCSCQSGGGANC